MLDQVKQEKIIAVLRHVPPAKLVHTVEALSDGGIKIIEVTMNSGDALKCISKLRELYSQEKLIIGAGTVLNLSMAKEAISAGAQFLISPNLDIPAIHYATEQAIDFWPGVITPTEAVNAWNAGANAVKLFPAGRLGAAFIKDIKGPLSDIPIIATGGITLQNQHTFLQAGAAAVGLGGELIKMDFINNNRFDELRQHASQFVEEISSESGIR
ncbi:bifunctional 4-hydroxy-2-oxoglutarate aldolase/2-dehydro-3-deoxy-phosphogluconate aldolase [Bacillus salipaludis]|uniref:Bifunctional 4-hydroxy-2-oxoglutarate aldolase/2-dehydro-3-deoxy-phosphogluconate aldolase n=1 Tax=Bacillus salipaludis TaxID=2547811 RepID=A0ABW8RK17_9BACI